MADNIIKLIDERAARTEEEAHVRFRCGRDSRRDLRAS